MNRQRVVVEVVATTIAAGAMVATPLARQRGTTRRALASAVIGGLAVTTASRAAERWGGARSAAAAAAVVVAATAVEGAGSRTGFPFGRYRYTGALQPTVAGVPVIVPLAWLAMAVPSREVAHAALWKRSTPLRRIALGAVALTAWDVFLDPQMVGEGYWSWVRTGRYRGIPLTNFAGWLLTSVGVMALLEATLPPRLRQTDTPLVGAYASMAALETLGFAAFFRDRVVAAAGGAAMLPFSLVAGWRLIGGTPRATRSSSAAA